MTNRYDAVVVAFDRDIRDDDAEAILNAIRMLKGVLSVTPNINDPISSHVAETRLRTKLMTQLFDLFNNKV